jgi:hypothetical protein
MSQKINAIIFSNDNPAQLSLLLDSIEKNAKDVFHVNIIASHSGDITALGYKNIENRKDYLQIRYIEPFDDLKEAVLEILKTGSKNNLDYSCFFLDDDIIYNKVELDEITSQIEADEDVVCFSMRLGENTTKCYTLGAENVLHDIRYDGKFMKWDWSLHYLDFGYPFAMDGHVFRTKDIYKLVRKCKFNTVEELEVGMFDFTETFPRNMMVSYKTSALVGVPIGRVQESIDNEVTMAIKDSRARKVKMEMTKQFRAGEFINLESIDFSDINGCHQELDLGVTQEEATKTEEDDRHKEVNQKN